jgi:hypothetical protein
MQPSGSMMMDGKVCPVEGGVAATGTGHCHHAMHSVTFAIEEKVVVVSV